MSTTEARRHRQRVELIGAAECAIAAKGLAGLRARDLAAEIGCSVGAIYNLVKDIDELVLLVGSRTLARLDSALGEATKRPPEGARSATDNLVAIAIAYSGFARENLNLWRTLFEHRMTGGAEVPDWAVADQMKLFRHITAPLEILIPHADETGRNLLTRTLFSAVHGVVAIGLEEKLVAVPRQLLDRQVETLVRLVGAGLQTASSGSGPSEAGS